MFEIIDIEPAWNECLYFFSSVLDAVLVRFGDGLQTVSLLDLAVGAIICDAVFSAIFAFVRDSGVCDDD